MKLRLTGLLSIYCLLVSIGLACSTASSVTQYTPPTTISSPTPPTATQTKPDDPIRSIDFANFTYPWVKDLGDPRNRFTLSNGELPPRRNQQGIIQNMGVSLERVEYGDVTGDGQDEAVIILTFTTGGSATPHAVYVYARHDDETKLLWSGAMGDRADGGLQKVYAQDGQLVVERFSPVENKGDCCPTHFTRTRYEWVRRGFRQKGKQETLSIP